MQKKTNKVIIQPSTTSIQKPVVQATVATTTTATPIAPANTTVIAPSTSNPANTKPHTTPTTDKAAATKLAVASPEKTASKGVVDATKLTSNTKANKTTRTIASVVPKVDKKAKKEKEASTPKVEKTEKQKKPKLIRDSFTFPKEEYEQLASLKARVLKMGIASKKTEILRAAIKNLNQLSDAQLLVAIHNIPNIKTGRPAA